MQECPCGHLGDPRFECRCTPSGIELYRARISGPLLDRIDLQVEVPALTLRDLKGPAGEPSSAVAGRVAGARETQLRRRGASCPAPTNAALSEADLVRHCRLDAAGQRLLDGALERLGLSARALTRILEVARSIADLAGCEAIGAAHVAEAIQDRALDRRLS